VTDARAIPVSGQPSAVIAAGRALAGRIALPGLVWLYLLTVALPIGFNVGSLAMTLLRLLLLIMVVPLTFKLLAGRYGKLLLVDILFFLHMGWATVALAVNNPNRVVENIGSTAVEFLGGYLIARACIRTPEAFAALIRALLLLVALTLPFAIAESQSGHAVLPALIEKVPGLTSVPQTDIAKRMGLERAQVVFAHPIHYGIFSSVVLSLVFVGLKDVMSPSARFLGAGAIGLAVFLSLSSGALLAYLLQLGLIVWAFIFRNVQKRWWLLFGLFALMYVVIDLLSNRTPIKVFMSYATFSAHNAYWRSIIFDWGMRNVWANPVFGLGLNNWVRPHYMSSGSMDNFWLVMAVRYGIPGFVLIALGYAAGLWRVARRSFAPGGILSQMRLGWMITFIGLSFSLSTVHVWTAIYSFVFFLFASGLWLVYAEDGADGQEGAAAPAGGRQPLAFSRSAADCAAGAAVAARSASGPVRGPASETGATPRRDAARPTAYTRFAPGHNRGRRGG